MAWADPIGAVSQLVHGREKKSFGKLKGNGAIGDLKGEDMGICVLRYDFR